ncbi:MAG: DnaB-like helicase C-terminal domain-containing protein [Candidatus Neptunochlamydia sp.]|nr:DnaB-like helicase C-terminal domain-containing protein [Candidatus Neptunochlamydia sp.]
MINGFGNSNLIILAGRPGMGKTAFSLNIVEHVAIDHGMPVGIFSLEMSAEQLRDRMICSQSEVESSKIQTGSLNSSEYQCVVQAAVAIQKAPIFIHDQPGLNITDLCNSAREMKELHDIKLIIIDYLQIISILPNYNCISDDKYKDITELARILKTLARELSIPILCGSQLSRQVEERTGHRPAC